MSPSRRSLLAAAAGCGVTTALGSSLTAPVWACAQPTTEPGGHDGIPFTCTGTSPIVCHADVAPGNYDVTVVLGAADVAASTEVRAEARRMMVVETATDAGRFSRHSFTVNVREPEGEPTLATIGTPGLTLTFTGGAPQVRQISIHPARGDDRRNRGQRDRDRLLTMFLIGDSTVCDQAGWPYTGWGQAMPLYFRRGLSVANYADSGESSVSFLDNPLLLDTMVPLVGRGDLVLIQLGHNDKTTLADDYRTNLTEIVTRIVARGGRPVLISPPVRRRLSKAGLLDDIAKHVWSTANLPVEMERVATEQGIPYINLTAETATLVEARGIEGSKPIYLTSINGDNTHLSEYGARLYAQLVLAHLKDLNLIPPHLYPNADPR